MAKKRSLVRGLSNILFKPSSSASEFKVVLDLEQDTVWATQAQISEIFGRDRTVITRHLNNIYSEGELDQGATSAKIAQVQFEGSREVQREITHYDLDVIISIGYRVRSPLATEFRKWATNVLKNYLIKGFVIDQERLKEQEAQINELQFSIDLLHDQAVEQRSLITQGFISIIEHYSKSFELLNKFDTEELSVRGLSKDIIYVINSDDVNSAITELKHDLIKKGEASELFGNEKDKSFKGILGSISQTVFSELAYPSVEEQAAQLLYSIIKGHSFSDGNKRIGSFIFVWFLEQNNFHLDNTGKRKISDNTLTALALAVAQSAPEQKDLMIKLIINLIKK